MKARKIFTLSFLGLIGTPSFAKQPDYKCAGYLSYLESPELYSSLAKEFPLIAERVIKSDVDPAIVVSNASILENSERIEKANQLLTSLNPNFKPSSKFADALIKAHLIGSNEPGLDPRQNASVFNYTKKQLEQKMLILTKEAGLTKRQADALIRYGFAGTDVIRDVIATVSTIGAVGSAIKGDSVNTFTNLGTAAAARGDHTMAALNYGLSAALELGQKNRQHTPAPSAPSMTDAEYDALVMKNSEKRSLAAEQKALAEKKMTQEQIGFEKKHKSSKHTNNVGPTIEKLSSSNNFLFYYEPFSLDKKYETPTTEVINHWLGLEAGLEQSKDLELTLQKNREKEVLFLVKNDPLNYSELKGKIKSFNVESFHHDMYVRPSSLSPILHKIFRMRKEYVLFSDTKKYPDMLKQYSTWKATKAGGEIVTSITIELPNGETKVIPSESIVSYVPLTET